MGGGILHELSEQAKRLVDNISFCLAGLSGAVTYASMMAALNMAAVIIAVMSGLVSLSWGVWRWRDRIKYGPPKGGAE